MTMTTIAETIKGNPWVEKVHYQDEFAASVSDNKMMFLWFVSRETIRGIQVTNAEAGYIIDATEKEGANMESVRKALEELK